MVLAEQKVFWGPEVAGTRWEGKASHRCQGRRWLLSRGWRWAREGGVRLRMTLKVLQLWAWDFMREDRGLWCRGEMPKAGHSEEGLREPAWGPSGHGQVRLVAGRSVKRPSRKGVQRGQSREGGWHTLCPLAKDWGTLCESHLKKWGASRCGEWGD